MMDVWPALPRDDSWTAMIVAKVGEEQIAGKMRNNRIGANGFLNRHCTLAPDPESERLP
jgi:hypothetical protein